MKKVFLIILLIPVITANAQPSFIKEYYNAQQEVFNKIIEINGTFFTAGSTGSIGAGAKDVLVTKINNSGNLLWTRVFGGSGNDEATSAIRTLEGNILIAGYSSSYSSLPGDSSDFFIIKIDTLGNLIWSKIISGQDKDIATNLIELADSNYLVIGTTRSFGAGSEDICLLKIDTSGSVIWSKVFGTPGIDFPASIVEDLNKNLLITGKTNGSSITGNIVFMLKTDSLGNAAWMKSYDLPGYPVKDCVGNDIILTYNNNYLLAGTAGIGTNPDTHPFLIETDTSGNVIWNKIYSYYSGLGKGISIRKLNAPGYIYGVWIGEATLVKMDITGTVQWLKPQAVFSATFIGTPSNAFQASDYSYVCAGTDLYNNVKHGFISKTNSSGDLPIPCIFVNPVGNTYSVAVNISNTNISSSIPSFTISDTIQTSGGTLFTISDCSSVGVEELSSTQKENELIIFPIPSADFIKIQSNIQSGELSIIDDLGSIVYFQDYIHNATLSIKDFPSGIYLIRIIDKKTQAFFSKRFLKN